LEKWIWAERVDHRTFLTKTRKHENAKKQGFPPPNGVTAAVWEKVCERMFEID